MHQMYRVKAISINKQMSIGSFSSFDIIEQWRAWPSREGRVSKNGVYRRPSGQRNKYKLRQSDEKRDTKLFALHSLAHLVLFATGFSLTKLIAQNVHACKSKQHLNSH